MEIKIDDKTYSFRYKINELSLLDYLDISDILTEDEYEQYEDINTKKMVNRKEPISRSNRSVEFIFDLYRKVIRRLSNIPLKYTKENELIEHCIELLTPTFEEIQSLMSSSIDNINDDISFEYKDEKVSFTSPNEWTFNKWVTLETYLSKGIQELVYEDGDEVGKAKTIVKGDRFLLPLLFGEWDDRLKDLDDKYGFFNNELSVKDTIQVYTYFLDVIYKIRKSHSFIYGEGGGIGGNSPNMSNHTSDFGWLDTLRALAEKGVFGTYIQLKDSPVFEVLEYLNTSVSHDRAQGLDYKINNSK